MFRRYEAAPAPGPTRIESPEEVKKSWDGGMLGEGNRGLFPPVGSSVFAACLLLSVLALTSCSSSMVNPGGNSSQDIDVMDKVRSLDILPRYPTQTGTSTTSSGPRAQPV